MVVDLHNIESMEEFHALVKSRFGFPQFYGCNWDAFWDGITGLVELPDKVVLTGWNKFSKRFPDDCKILSKIVAEYNSDCGKRIEFDLTNCSTCES